MSDVEKKPDEMSADASMQDASTPGVPSPGIPASDAGTRLIKEFDKLRDTAAALVRRLDALREETEAFVEHTQNSDSILDRLARHDVSVWTEPTRLSPERIPRFVPIQERPLGSLGISTRLVSLINLKGGVGKTTLCANLTAAFASGNYRTPTGERGKPLRVLVVDLDFQGTLSGRCLTSESLRESSRQKLTADCLLSGSAARSLGGGKKLSVPFIHCPQTARVIPADDRLDGEDFRRQAKLALHLAETRFAYRCWFHTEAVFKAYDLILFDCPPRLTSSTVCSLAASDAVFIPTAPDGFDIPAVNRTIRWIGAMRNALALPVRVAGIILNRTNKNNGLSRGEKSRQNELEGYMKEFLQLFPASDGGGRPFILKSNIPRRAGEQDPINGHPGEPLPGETKDFFAELAGEIFERIF